MWESAVIFDLYELEKPHGSSYLGCNKDFTKVPGIVEVYCVIAGAMVPPSTENPENPMYYFKGITSNKCPASVPDAISDSKGTIRRSSSWLRPVPSLITILHDVTFMPRMSRAPTESRMAESSARMSAISLSPMATIISRVAVVVLTEFYFEASGCEDVRSNALPEDKTISLKEILLGYNGIRPWSGDLVWISC
ncbi:hypothetical protein llap_15363 [Limosa lapponica baueri]|uniref:Uncharacterized protein n=1 Tax=Limosa lapponica baueri TaxID=1758121 RepID=A0A2I0TKS6_LIMLA|nr:hypothetical protein llap_15363 [Limosa lapponica baueri]